MWWIIGNCGFECVKQIEAYGKICKNLRENAKVFVLRGGDREWFFIYPRLIIGKKYVQNVSKI